jgi:hypothetical protein
VHRRCRSRRFCVVLAARGDVEAVSEQLDGKTTE